MPNFTLCNGISHTTWIYATPQPPILTVNTATPVESVVTDGPTDCYLSSKMPV